MNKKDFCISCNKITDHIFYKRIGPTEEWDLKKCRKCKKRTPLY